MENLHIFNGSIKNLKKIIDNLWLNYVDHFQISIEFVNHIITKTKPIDELGVNELKQRKYCYSSSSVNHLNATN